MITVAQKSNGDWQCSGVIDGNSYVFEAKTAPLAQSKMRQQILATGGRPEHYKWDRPKTHKESNWVTAGLLQNRGNSKPIPMPEWADYPEDSPEWHEGSKKLLEEVERAFNTNKEKQ